MKKLLTSIWMIAVLTGCFDEGSVERVTFEAAGRGANRDTASPLVVTTRNGWSVTLEQARLSVGPLYFGNALATGYQSEVGRPVAEVLSITTIDALSPTPTIFAEPGRGVSEMARAAEVRLAEAADGPIAERAGPNEAVAFVSGVARREAEEIPFAGNYAIPLGRDSDAYTWSQQHRITNIPVSFVPRDGGALTLIVDPRGWVDSVRFERLPVGDDGVRDFDDDAVQAQLRAGVAVRDAFHVEWTDPPSDP